MLCVCVKVSKGPSRGKQSLCEGEQSVYGGVGDSLYKLPHTSTEIHFKSRKTYPSSPHPSCAVQHESARRVAFGPCTAPNTLSAYPSCAIQHESARRVALGPCTAPNTPDQILEIITHIQVTVCPSWVSSKSDVYFYCWLYL